MKRECFIFKVNEEMGRMEFGEEGVAPIVHWPAIPPWVLPVPEIDLSVLAYERTATFGGIVRERLNNTWGQYIQIYTDGAQDPRTGKSGFAFCIPDLDVSRHKRLSEGVSVYTTELLAITWAMQWVEEVRPSGDML